MRIVPIYRLVPNESVNNRNDKKRQFIPGLWCMQLSHSSEQPDVQFIPYLIWFSSQLYMVFGFMYLVFALVYVVWCISFSEGFSGCLIHLIWGIVFGIWVDIFDICIGTANGIWIDVFGMGCVSHFGCCVRIFNRMRWFPLQLTLNLDLPDCQFLRQLATCEKGILSHPPSFPSRFIF